MKKLSVSMTRPEAVLGLIYIPIQLFVIPVLAVVANIALTLSFSAAEINFLCFAVNFAVVTVIFHRYLIASWNVLRAAPKRSLSSCGLGLALYFAATMAVSILITVVEPDFSNANDGAISDMMTENSVLMTIGAVLLAPVVEELLYRGVVFGQLYRRWPLAAYIISAAVFSSLHIIGYISSYTPIQLLLAFIQYVPASIVLAWIYVRSDTILVPILVHILINTIALSAM